MNLLDRLGLLVDGIEAVARAAVLGLTLLVLLVMLAQVFFRYVLNSSLQWSEELAVWGMVWMVFVGSVLLVRRSEHISITTLVRLAPLPVRPYLVIFNRAAGLVFLVIVGYYGFEVFGGTFHAKSPSIGLSTRWIKLAIPAGAVLMAVVALYAIADDLRRLANRDFASFGEID